MKTAPLEFPGLSSHLRQEGRNFVRMGVVPNHVAVPAGGLMLAAAEAIEELQRLLASAARHGLADDLEVPASMPEAPADVPAKHRHWFDKTTNRCECGEWKRGHAPAPAATGAP